MDFEEIENILDTSDPDSWMYDIDYGIFTYKPDVELTIEKDSKDERFEEDWCKEFPDEKASKVIMKIFYSNSFVKSYLYVWVDGGRFILPPPKRGEKNTITRFQYNLGRILNETRNNTISQEDYNQQIDRAGFEILD